MRKILAVTLIFGAASLALVRCGSTTSTSSGTTYGSTSNQGDYATWTVDGDNLDVVWQKITTAGTVDQTYTIGATCGTADATYAYKTCTIDSFSCADGASACSGGPAIGETFEMLEQPGIAIWVHTGSGASSELHVGMVLDTMGCDADVSGDYTFARLDMSNDATELFGFYHSDADFSTVTHGDFKMNCTASCGGSLGAATKTLTYATGGGSGNGIETLTGTSCSNGVRSRNISGVGDIRSMMTSGGLFVLDLPSGAGGLVSFKTSNAATLADLAGRNIVAISFPDNSSPKLIAGTFGSVSGDDAPITITEMGGGSTSVNFSRLDSSTGSSYTVPSAFASSGNTLASTFGTLDQFSDAGLFKISDGSDNNVFAAIAKYNNKLVGFGVVYNLRSGTIKNTGNFILFEKP